MAKTDLMTILKEAGFRGQGLANAYAIALAESGGRARAHNPNAATGDNSYGLFQINMLGKMGPARLKQYGLSSNNDLFDPLTNAKVAYKMSHGGTNFQPWTTFTSGKYKNYLGQSGAQVTGAQMTSDKTAKTTAEDYGFVKAFLKAHPDVAAVVRQAVAKGYTQARFQAEIKDTTWWKSRTESQRSWDVMSVEDPAKAKQTLATAQAHVQQKAASLGITLTAKEEAAYAKQFVVNGMDDTEQAAHLAKEFALPGAGGALTGTAAQTEGALKATAQAYGVQLSASKETKYIQQVLSGDATPADFEDVFREQAKVLYPTISKFLDNGGTVHDYLNPYWQIASNELGIPDSAMNTTDAKWTKMLTGANGQPMDANMWTQTIRNDPVYKWDQSIGAKNVANDFVNQMRSIMGG